MPKKGIGRIPAKAAGYDNPPSAARAAATPFQKGGFWQAATKRLLFEGSCRRRRLKIVLFPSAQIASHCGLRIVLIPAMVAVYGNPPQRPRVLPTIREGRAALPRERLPCRFQPEIRAGRRPERPACGQAIGLSPRCVPHCSRSAPTPFPALIRWRNSGSCPAKQHARAHTCI